MAFTDDIFSFSALDPTGFSQSWREFAEKSATHSRGGYGKMKSAAEEATCTAESTVHSAQQGTMELGIKAIDMMRSNAEMSFSHLESLLGAKTFSQVLELQASFVRRQTELGVEQARVMQEAARKVADHVAGTGRDQSEKSTDMANRA